MKRLLGRLGTALFAGLMLFLAALIVVPGFLDRIYYAGPVSNHFDGNRFFNPDGSPAADTQRQRSLTPRFFRFFTGQDRAVWPESVAVTPTRPPDRVMGGAMRAIWVGHSTVLVQTQGLNILTDPIWSDKTGPFAMGPKRHRAPGINFDDLPKIDLVLISHNHYDHLDLPTLRRLWQRDRPKIVTGLGNDSLLNSAGIPSIARDWGQQVPIGHGISVFVDRVHHWDSRWFRDRNRALWAGFTVVLPGGNLFFAGDTGYGDGRWPDAAARHGRVRLALIPIGAFKPREIMADSHIGPREAVQVYEELGAVYAISVHWGTFQLSQESISEPPTLLRRYLREERIVPGRFRTLEAGQPWLVPPISDFQRVSGTLE